MRISSLAIIPRIPRTSREFRFFPGNPCPEVPGNLPGREKTPGGHALPADPYAQPVTHGARRCAPSHPPGSAGSQPLLSWERRSPRTRGCSADAWPQAPEEPLWVAIPRLRAPVRSHWLAEQWHYLLHRVHCLPIPGEQAGHARKLAQPCTPASDRGAGGPLILHRLRARARRTCRAAATERIPPASGCQPSRHPIPPQTHLGSSSGSCLRSCKLQGSIEGGITSPGGHGGHSGERAAKASWVSPNSHDQGRAGGTLSVSPDPFAPAGAFRLSPSHWTFRGDTERVAPLKGRFERFADISVGPTVVWASPTLRVLERL